MAEKKPTYKELEKKIADLEKQVNRTQSHDNIAEINLNGFNDKDLISFYFNKFPIGINIFDKRGTVVYVNQYSRSIFGVEPNDALTGYCLFDDPSIKDETKKALKNGETAEEERYIDFNAIYHHKMYKTSRTLNEKLCIHLTYVPYFESSEIKGFLVSILDLTPSKVFEQKMLESEKKYKLLIDNINDLVCEIDEFGTFTYLNDKFFDIFGYHTEDLLGTNVADKIHPDDIDLLKMKLENMSVSNINSIITWRCKNKFDEYRLIESKGKVYINSNNEKRVVVISRDTTHQNETEKALIIAKEKAEENEVKYKSLSESSKDYIVRFDKNCRYLYFNSVTSEFLKMPLETLLNKTIRESGLFNEEQSTFWENAIEKVFQTQELFQIQFDYKLGDKTLFFDRMLIPEKNEKNEVVSVLSVARDITFLKQSEQALKASKAKLKAILHAILDMMFVQNFKGEYIDYYAPMPEKLYAEPNFFIGKNMSEVLPPELAKELKLVFEKAIETKLVQIYEYSIKLTTGIEFYESRIIVFEDDKILSILRNITERKQAEIALKESEERYKRITESITDYLYTVKVKNGKAIETIHNEGCKIITGYSPEEFLNDKYLWINMVVPEEREMVRELFNKIIEGEIFPPIEHRIICKNEKIRWVSDTVIPKYNLNSEIISYDGIITDITERKQAEIALKESEEKFRMMVLNNPDLAIYQDETGKVIFINQQATKVLGHNSDDFISTTFPDFIHPEDKEPVSAALKNVLNGKSLENYEYRFYTKEGEINYLSHNAKPVIVNDKFIGIVSSIRNVTDNKIIEKSLKESELWYKSLSEAKDKFFSIIAHDLTGPYSNVLRLLELLQKNINNYPLPKIEKFVDNVYLLTKNAFLLLQSLLIWAKSQRGLLSYNPEQINLMTILNSEIELFKVQAAQKKIELINNLNSDITVVADVTMLKSILQNLISNAIKYSNEEGRIDLFAEGKSDFVEICIKDCGIGMDEETQNKLFKLDANLITTGTADEQGSGLGLILCKEFIDKHKGKILVKSQLGIGSEFTFTIPKSNFSNIT